MKYVSWAALYEGSSDALYLNVLLPRLIRDLVAHDGQQLVEVPDTPAVKLGMGGRSVEKVVAEACAFREAFHVIFIHADTGGRGIDGGLSSRSDAYCEALRVACDWPSECCVTITPRHEIEAWLLADGHAVVDALGYRGDPIEVGLPNSADAAERLGDPKQVLKAAITQVAGRRRGKTVENIFPAVAQRQRLELLRKSSSFLDFELRLRRCLESLRCFS